jgi:REP element-mobilizing transposase RayT
MSSCPNTFHLLLGEPEVGSPSTVMQVLKQRSAHALLPRIKRRNLRQARLFDGPSRMPFWQARFYDFNVWTEQKRVEKLNYMHQNPVKRELVDEPEQWLWSSYRHYAMQRAGPVRVNEGWAKISFRDRVG